MIVLLIQGSLSVIVAVAIFGFTFFLRKSDPRWILLGFLFTLVLGIVLIAGNVNTFPYSNILVFAFATFTGILLGGILRQRMKLFFLILLISSALDILLFTSGVNGPSSSSSPPTGESAAMSYLNFRIPLRPSLHFTIGILDLLFVSAVVAFFAASEKIGWKGLLSLSILF
jgi:hypothetical protein